VNPAHPGEVARAELPHCMVPSAFVLLDAFPCLSSDLAVVNPTLWFFPCLFFVTAYYLPGAPRSFNIGFCVDAPRWPRATCCRSSRSQRREVQIWFKVLVSASLAKFSQALSAWFDLEVPNANSRRI